MKTNKVDGIKYGTKVWGDDRCGYSAYVTKAAPKTYGKHTAYGARTVMKVFCEIFIPSATPEESFGNPGGSHKTQALARQAAQARLDELVAERLRDKAAREELRARYLEKTSPKTVSVA